jgi:hypothetical protein
MTVKATKAELLEALRDRVIYQTYRGNRLVGRCCDLCGYRWKGLKERHLPECLIERAS